MSAIPAYRAIRDHLEGEIGKRQPNDRLPTQSELSSQFGVSHLTVRRALRELEDAGLIFRMRGKGTFVRRQPPRSCSTFRIAVVLPAYMQVSEIWGDLLRGFVREMPNRPLTLLIHPLDADLRSLERTVVREGFHGVIAPFPYAAETAAIRHLFRIGHPVIVVNRIVKDAGIHYVSTDHFGGARELARHLVSRGHRRFAVVGVQETSFVRERTDGLRAALAEAGMRLDPAAAVPGPDGGDEAERRRRTARAFGAVLDAAAPTAVFVTRGELLEPVVSEIRRRGLRIPDDIEAATYDRAAETIEERPFIHEALQPAFEMGRIAVEGMERLLRGEETAVRRVIPPEIRIKHHAIWKERGTVQ